MPNKKKQEEVNEDNNEPKRADYKLRNYTKDSLHEDINKLQKQIKKLEQSINEHDSELEEKRANQKKLKQRLQEMVSIQELLAKIQM